MPFQRTIRPSLPDGGSEANDSARGAPGPPSTNAKVGSPVCVARASSSVTSQVSAVLNARSPLEVATIRVPPSEPRFELTPTSTVIGVVPGLVSFSR